MTIEATRKIGDERRKEAVEGIAQELGQVMRRHLDECTRTCLNCEHFTEKHVNSIYSEICSLAGKRPPARIIAFGCEHYKDQIPF